MRRGDLWQQAVRKVEEALGDLGPNDDVALFTYNDRLHTLVGFDSEPLGRAGKPDLVGRRLRELGPSWGGSDLGTALATVAGELESIDDVRRSLAEPRLVLVSDLAHGCRTETLQAFEWPQRVSVQAHVVSPSQTTNAAARLLVDDESGETETPCVRVTNAADSTGDQFILTWSDVRKMGAESKNSASKKPASNGKVPGGAVSIHVPAGQSRVVRLPRPESAPADSVVLGGDEAEFDNVYYTVPLRQQHVSLAYVGADAVIDRDASRYYLDLALADDPLRKVEFAEFKGDEPLPLADARPQLVIVSEAVSEAARQALARFADVGGTLLLVPREHEAAVCAAALLGDVEAGDEGSEARKPYLMLGEIDFTHPLFAAFSNPRYNDFTKIHFWKHRPLTLKPGAATRVVARFDNGDPAIVERAIGAGRALLFASGWQPDDSQLALSSKFVPLIQAILELACGPRLDAAGVAVGQVVPLTPTSSTAAVVVTKPDATRIELPPGTNVFAGTDQPGLYRVQSGDDDFQFAVNLAGAESDTAPLGLEPLTQLGVRFDRRLTRAEQAERLRQQRDTELESRQKAWKWLLVAALGVLIVETALAGRAARQIGQGQ
jgi:hypothetical protein